jgi:hypothetical protein
METPMIRDTESCSYIVYVCWNKFLCRNGNMINILNLKMSCL